jgi:hypothetical protein
VTENIKTWIQDATALKTTNLGGEGSRRFLTDHRLSRFPSPPERPLPMPGRYASGRRRTAPLP